MTRAYRIAKGWRIFIYIFGPLLMALFIYLLIAPFIQQEFDWKHALFFAPISLAMITLFTIGIIDTIKGKLLLDDDKVTLITTLKTKTLQFDEIKGFRVDNNYVHVVPLNPARKKIKISTYTEKSAEIIEWFSAHFPELDTSERLEAEAALLENQEYGLTKQARESRWLEARRVARITNAAGFVFFLWITFYTRPYGLSVSIGMGYPFVILMLLVLYRGLLRMDEKKNSAYPSVLTGFLMAGLGLTLRALLDFNILDYKQLWLVVSSFSIILLSFILIVTQGFILKKAEDYFSVLGVAISVFCFVFGSYILANCIYDPSKPKLFKREVVDKEISGGKTASYYLYIQGWQEQTGHEKIKATAEQYNAVTAGDYVTIYQMTGLFKTPWFFVTVE